MKFLRTSLLLCAISLAFLAKAQEISTSFYKYHLLPPDPGTFAATETITIPAGIQTITKNETTGIVTVTDTKGVKHDLPQGKDVAVVDEKGRGALVDKQGQITNTTAEQAKAAAKREYGFSIVFEKAPGSKAGFDKYDEKTTALKNTYETIDQYHVPWKAISTGADVVKGSLNFGTAKDLVFEQEGAKLTYNEFTNILTVNSVPAGSTAQVIVKEKTGDKEKIRGKLNVAGYAPMSKTVHIVPVNNAASPVSEADLKKYLDDVYGQALVSWQVDIKNKIDIPLTGDFDDGGSGLLSTYTGDMRKVIKAYGSLEQDHYYIFLLEHGKNKTGYMPRGKRAGFVFLNNQNSEELKHTIAHELGHGAFTLRHPFAEYPSVTEKSTDNLMDYAGGTHLYKWQWDQIHNPVLVMGLFEGDEEGEYIGQIVKCLSAAALDVAMNYTFKWVELNFLDQETNNDFSLTDFSNIWAALNKGEVITSASLACASSVLPFISKNKSKVIAAATASIGAGAAAMVADICGQYEDIKGEQSFSEKFSQLDWGQSFRKAGVQALIAGISTGVATYAIDHPVFRNFGTKLKNLGYPRIRQILKYTGFSDETIDAWCRKWGVSKGAKAWNIWDDIIIKGKKGVKEVLSSRYKNIDEYLAGAEYATKVASDFVRYQARGGLSNLASYTTKHKVITRNRMAGKIAEDVFTQFESGIKPGMAIQTSDGARYIDNLLDGTAREIKSGRITLNGADFQRQIKKDIEIIAESRSSEVSKIEWHALDGIDDNALKFIHDEMTRKGVSANNFKVVIY